MIGLLLAFRSSGELAAGERKLLDAGVDVRTAPSPDSADSGGGICLVIDPADLGKAKLLLGNSIRAVYRIDENGKDPAPWVP